MATRKTTAETPAEDGVERLLSALGDGDTLYLHGWHDVHGKGYIGPLAVDGTEEPHEVLERIRREHGPGKYYLQRKTREGWAGSATFTVLPRAGDVPRGGKEPDRLDRLAEMVEKLAERMDRPASSGVADLGKHAAELAAGLMNAQMPLITALAERSSGDADRMVDTLLRGMELGQGNNSTGGDSGDRFSTMLAAILARMDPNGGTPPGPPAPQVAPGPAWVEHARPYAGALASAVGRDPEVVAQAMAELLPDDLLDAIADDAAAPERLAALHPSLGDEPAKRWLRELWTALTSPPDESEEEEGPEPAPEEETAKPGPSDVPGSEVRSR